MHDRRFVPLTLLLAVAVLLLPVASQAQSFNGSISGTAVDPSGSPVAGAELVLKNTGTGVELKRTTGPDGAYAFRNLLPGTYELTGTFAGMPSMTSSRRWNCRRRSVTCAALNLTCSADPRWTGI